MGVVYAYVHVGTRGKCPAVFSTAFHHIFETGILTESRFHQLARLINKLRGLVHLSRHPQHWFMGCTTIPSFYTGTGDMDLGPYALGNKHVPN